MLIYKSGIASGVHILDLEEDMYSLLYMFNRRANSNVDQGQYETQKIDCQQ